MSHRKKEIQQIIATKDIKLFFNLPYLLLLNPAIFFEGYLKKKLETVYISSREDAVVKCKEVFAEISK